MGWCRVVSIVPCLPGKSQRLPGKSQQVYELVAGLRGGRKGPVRRLTDWGRKDRLSGPRGAYRGVGVLVACERMAGSMALISLEDLHIGYRGPPLLEGVDCRIRAGEKIGLLGRNGAGKTTLLRLLEGAEEPDAGKVTIEEGVRVASLPQDVPRDLRGTVGEAIRQGVAGLELADWEQTARVERLADRMELGLDASCDVLSSGMKRRVLLARSMVAEPDVLLLDEPTNHLDLPAIGWLEEYLVQWPGTILFVTHDRTFLQKLAGRILEIDRGRLFDWSCDYETFVKRKEAALAEEEKQNALFDKKLAQEEAWIRQGIKARRTRNEGRVRALKELRNQRHARREQTGPARIRIQEGQRSGRLVAEVEDITFAYTDQPIVTAFSTQIMRGDKIGVIGPNGVGKTTLLRLLLGELSPQEGNVRLGANLQVAYFDQLREQLDEETSIADNVADGSSSITFDGRGKHVLGYLQEFLFTPERSRQEVKFLSGGERNRLLLAKLFAKPSNVLVLDEPTNDLDTETLELLEQRVVEYQGAVLLVSHDRTFLNNVATSTIAFETGGVREYVGGYDDWVRQTASQPVKKATPKPKHNKPGKTRPRGDTKRGGLNYQQRQELAALPAQIEACEAEMASLYETMADAEFYKQPDDVVAEETARMKEFEEQLAAAYARWEELESLADGQ